MADHPEIAILELTNHGTNRDFQTLFSMPNISIAWVKPQDYKGGAKLIILPGSSRSVADYLELVANGGRELLESHLSQGGSIFGMCGGLQILSSEMYDPGLTQGDVPYVKTLGLINGFTVFGPTMISTTVRAELIAPCKGIVGGVERRSGYTVFNDAGFTPLAHIIERKYDDGQTQPAARQLDLTGGAGDLLKAQWAPGGESIDGLVSNDRRIWVSYIHLLLTNSGFLEQFLPIVLAS
ncbi:MAG: hypothetical protein ACRD3W_31150 [Terriglobales bacterium]